MTGIDPKKKLRLILICLMMSLSACLVSGASFLNFNSKVKLDTSAYPVCRHITAGEMIRAASGAGKSTDIRNGSYYAVSGIMKTKNDSNRKFSLISDPSSKKAITCTASDAEVINGISLYGPGDHVTVYGKLTLDIFSNISIKVCRIETENSAASDSSFYSPINGLAVNVNTMDTKTLGNGKFVYRIPQAWKSVEHDIPSEDLGVMEGYQYRLNELKKSEYAESFFVCYFDIDKFVAIKDKGNNLKLIEEAILRDILRKDNNDRLEKFPSKSVTTYYGAPYRYYQDTYEKMTGDKYQAEFIFQEAGEDGIVVYLYIYNTQKVREPDENIMLTMRLAEVR